MILSIDTIIIAILFFVTFVSIAALVRIKLRNTKLTLSVTQLTIDKQVLGEELDRLSFISSNSVDIENGFIKFLSETRDSAYEYIENVQGSIAELQAAMESGNEEDIAVAYKKLLDFLPSSSTGMID
jgi:uncharacterized membrane protein